MWEGEGERDIAENFAEVLTHLAPQLAGANLNTRGGQGTVTVEYGTKIPRLPRVLVRAASWASYFDQLMRMTLDV